MNPLRETLSLALYLAALGHFIIPIAGLQVPYRLNWKTDLAQLTNFNRKLMWTYAGTTLLTILAFGILTLALHDAFLARDPAAVALAAFIAIFWTLRLAVDFAWFHHTDWPKGPAFILGHILLVTLFLALAATYWLVVLWSFHP